jgi:hypothetical protein
MEKQKFTLKVNNINVVLHDQPNKCPYCHNNITPAWVHKNLMHVNDESFVSVFFICPTVTCKRAFVGYPSDQLHKLSGYDFNVAG